MGDGAVMCLLTGTCMVIMMGVICGGHKYAASVVCSGLVRRDPQKATMLFLMQESAVKWLIMLTAPKATNYNVQTGLYVTY